ncbi:MAG: hypothetical protein RLN83_05155 [Balneola sp.]
MKIKGRIIRILDSRTVIINLGKNQGITKDSIFSILAEHEEVIDPQTNEVLGKVNVVKSKLKAATVEDKYTIATTSWTRSSAQIQIMKQFFGGLDYESQEIDWGELNVSEDQIQPWKAREELPVNIGDEVEVNVSSEIATHSEVEQEESEVNDEKKKEKS